MKTWVAAAWCALVALVALAAPAIAQTTAVGTAVRNVAQLGYEVEGAARFTLTNAVELRVEPADTRGRVALARYATTASDTAMRAAAGPTQCLSNSGILALTSAVVAGVGAVDPVTPLPLAETGAVHAGDPVFLRVEDADQDRDGAVRETVEVRVSARDTGDSETLRLLETGVDSGVFVGFLPTRVGSATSGDCLLQLARDSSLDVSYVDARDPADSASASGLVDPFGVVFDSTTGEPLDGMRVRLLGASGQPAIVFGDDGVSRYPSEMITGQLVTDAGGTTYRLPRGVYRFPLVASGAYRLVVEPAEGHVFPSTAVPEDLQRLPGAPYRLGEGSFGRAFAVLAPVVTAIDVPLDPQGRALSLRKSANTEVAAVGDFVAYELLVENGSRVAAIRNVTVSDRLPPGVRYRRGSVRLDGQPTIEPRVGALGDALTFEIPLLASGRSLRIRYVTELTVAVRGDELVNTATATASGGIASNEAQARVRVRNELFSDRSFIVGRVIAGGCEADAKSAPGVEGVAIYLEDGRYAVTDRDGRYHFEGVTPGAHVVQADVATGGEALQFAACGARTRHAGRRYSQFVDLRAGALWRVDFRLLGPVPPRGRAANAADAAAQAVATRSASAALTDAPPADEPHVAPVDFSALRPGIRFVTPEADATPAIASLHVAVAHFPGQRVALSVNGRAASALNFDGTETDADRTMSVSRWRGIDLRDGSNLLQATVRDSAGATIETLTRTVHYGGGPVRAEFDRAASVLVADGRSRPVVVLRLFDSFGRPARPGTIGAFRVNPPYRSWWEVQALDDNPLLSTGTREPTFEVGEGGVARLELEPTTQAGTAVLALRFNERQAQEVRAWLEPAARDWIMVGIASGTAAWRSLSGNSQAVDAAGDPLEEGFDGAGRVAFFAKGRVRGDALLTIAYDSAKDPGEARKRLQGVIEPDQYYTLYSDGAEPRVEAASTEKLFIKLERRQFVALFGDFDSGLTVTELTRYARSLTGLKADFAGERIAASGFAARTDLGAARDELRGDGTSGLYRLTRTPIMIGSDKIRIEVRDRFRTERVLERRELARFLDYRLDYARGELFFKEPVPSRDEQFNPVYIIAEYETGGAGQEVTTAGARAAVRTDDGRFEVGASLVRDGALAGNTDLAGVDLRWFASPVTELRAEVARSRSDDPSRRSQASAYLAELSHVTEKVEAELYLREQQADFGVGVGQQLSTEGGTRRAGFDVRWKLSPRWSLESEMLSQRSLESAAERQLAAAALRYEQDATSVGFGLRHVDDDVPNQGRQRSDLAFVTGAVDVLERRVTLRAAADAALGGRDQSIDYPARTLFGADWHLRDDIDLFVEWEHARGESQQSDMTQVGVRARPWERTQVLSSVSQQITEDGPRSFANLGLTQGFRLTERWTFDVGLDQSNTLRGAPLQPLVSAQQPLASGSTGAGTASEDFLSTFVGSQFHDERWTLTSRAERRTADSGERWTFSGGWYREQSAGHSLSLALQHLDEALRAEPRAETRTELRFAWAWRPSDSSWIVFNRTDLERERRIAGQSLEETLRWVNNTHANWQWRDDQQLGLQLGLRRVIGTFDEQRLRGTSVLLGVDYRLDLPWQAFGRALDLGLHGVRLESREAGVVRHGLGFDVGITPAANVWLSVGYNIVGFDDADFGASRHTSRGPYIAVRIKADQDTFKDLRLDSLRAPR